MWPTKRPVPSRQREPPLEQPWVSWPKWRMVQSRSPRALENLPARGVEPQRLRREVEAQRPQIARQTPVYRMTDGAYDVADPPARRAPHQPRLLRNT